MSQVVISTTEAVVDVIDNGAASTVVIPSAAVQVTVSTDGPSGGAVILGPILESAQVIAENYTLTTSKNGLSVGPVEVAATYTVTVPANAVWMVA